MQITIFDHINDCGYVHAHDHDGVHVHDAGGYDSVVNNFGSHLETRVGSDRRSYGVSQVEQTTDSLLRIGRSFECG